MSQSTRFAAQCLDASAAAYAGYAASLLLERRPELEERYAPGAMGHWKAHLLQRTRELAAALAAEEPELFRSRIRWEDRALKARGMGNEDLLAGLACLGEVLGEELPEAAREEVAVYLSMASDSLSEPSRDERTALDPSGPNGRLALRYLECLLEGDSRRALDLIVAAHREGTGVHELYSEVLLAAQRQAGEMWHLGELGVAEEHFITATTERAMSVLAHGAERASELGRTVVTAAVAGNGHGLGVQVVADFFEFAGWRAICLGPNVPPAEVATAVVAFEADLVALAAALATHLKPMRQTVEEIRRLSADVKVLVGGGVFAEAPELWRRLGADASAASAEAAVVAGERLLGLEGGRD